MVGFTFPFGFALAGLSVTHIPRRTVVRASCAAAVWSAALAVAFGRTFTRIFAPREVGIAAAFAVTDLVSFFVATVHPVDYSLSADLMIVRHAIRYAITARLNQ